MGLRELSAREIALVTIQVFKDRHLCKYAFISNAVRRFWCIWGFWAGEGSLADRGPTGREAQMPYFRPFPVTDESDRTRVCARRRGYCPQMHQNRFGEYPARIRTEAGPPNRHLPAGAQVLAMPAA